MSRLKQLEARRRMLLRRSGEQREELAARLAELTPGAVLRGAVDAAAIGTLRHPLAWAAALAGMLFLGRTREVLTFVLWVRSALALAGRAAHVVRLLTRLGAPRAGP
ncbi:MAG TPA: hypothetical protein VM713_09830 [Steroidobacteraceae bacterium]|nr:hypothetical protein [Steroidobacteraceae bacterium]